VVGNALRDVTKPMQNISKRWQLKESWEGLVTYFNLELFCLYRVRQKNMTIFHLK